MCPDLAVRFPSFSLDSSHTVCSHRWYFKQGENGMCYRPAYPAFTWVPQNFIRKAAYGRKFRTHSLNFPLYWLSWKKIPFELKGAVIEIPCLHMLEFHFSGIICQFDFAKGEEVRIIGFKTSI